MSKSIQVLAVISFWFATILCAVTPAFPSMHSHYERPAKKGEPYKDRVIVFVHGLFGNEDDTWRYSPEVYWPKLLLADEAFKETDIYVADYESPYHGNTMTVDEVAASLNSQLENDEVFSGHREVIFVCHSLGGIIAQQLLLTHREYAKQVPFIYFFATPQTGAALARLGTAFSSDPLLEALLPGESNHYLENLEFNWKGAHFKIARYCAYEKKPYKGFLIVDRLSGTRNCDEELPINEDHIGIVKPNDASHPSYVALHNAIRKHPIPKRAVTKANKGKSAKTSAEQLKQEQLKQEQERVESFNTLAGSVTVGSSGDVLHSMFTVTNGGKVAVQARAVYCFVHKMMFGISNTFGPGVMSVMTSGPITIEPGGDAESEACLAVIGGVDFVGCADISLTVDYALEDQPDIGQRKVFRFVTRRESDGLHWYRKPVETPGSYCFDRVFQSPYGTIVPQPIPPPSKSPKGPSDEKNVPPSPAKANQKTESAATGTTKLPEGTKDEAVQSAKATNPSNPTASAGDQSGNRESAVPAPYGKIDDKINSPKTSGEHNPNASPGQSQTPSDLLRQIEGMLGQDRELTLLEGCPAASSVQLRTVGENISYYVCATQCFASWVVVNPRRLDFGQIEISQYDDPELATISIRCAKGDLDLCVAVSKGTVGALSKGCRKQKQKTDYSAFLAWECMQRMRTQLRNSGRSSHELASRESAWVHDTGLHGCGATLPARLQTRKRGILKCWHVLGSPPEISQRVKSPSMRRPVGVKSILHWLH